MTDEEKKILDAFGCLDDESAAIHHREENAVRTPKQPRDLGALRLGVCFSLPKEELIRRNAERKNKADVFPDDYCDIERYREAHELASRSVCEGLLEFSDPMAYFVRRAKAIQNQVKDLQNVIDVWPEIFNAKLIEGTKGRKKKVFSTLDEAEQEGFSRIGIDRCLRGENKTHKGFHWKYIAHSW